MTKETLIFISTFCSGFSMGLVIANLIWMYLTRPK